MTHKIRVSKDGINFEWVVINTWFNPVKVIWNPVMEDMEDERKKEVDEIERLINPNP